MFCGNYSFKTSGEVTVQRQATIFDTIPPTAFTIVLPNEIGQAEISTLDRKADSVVMVLNYYDGDVVVARGFCQGQEITLKEFTYNNLTISIENGLNVTSTVKVNATGHMYDENTLILDMNYRGRAMLGPINYNIQGEHITLVATRN